MVLILISIKKLICSETLFYLAKMCDINMCVECTKIPKAQKINIASKKCACVDWHFNYMK